MNHPRRSAQTFAVALALTLALGAYGAAPAETAEPRPGYRTAEGAIRVVGNDGMEEMLRQMNAGFRRTHEVTFALVLKGSSTGIGGLTAGVSAFAPMGREAWPLELRPFRQTYGYAPLDIRIGRDGYAAPGRKNPPAIYVHASNPLAGLTLAQVEQVFCRGNPAGDITHWSQLGLPTEWSGRAMHVYGPRDDGGLATATRYGHLDGRPFARTYEPLAKSADVIRAVAADPFGIGFAGFFDAAKLPPTVKMLPLAAAAGAPYSTATYEEVAAGKYPLAPYLHLYLNRPPGQPLAGWLKAYVAWVLSPEGQAVIGRLRDSEEGYLPLRPEEAAAERRKLD